MKLTKCSNNHFYDGDKFSQCPHCAKLTGNPPVSQKREPQSKWEVSKKPEPQSKWEISQKQEPEHSGKTIAKTSSMWEAERQKEEASQIDIHRGFDVEDYPLDREEGKEPSADPTEGVADHWQQTSVSFSGVAFREVSPQEEGSLRGAVNSARGMDQTEDTKTVAFYHFDEKEPVVGWIICVKGAYMGESFPLKAGRNFVGRSLKMDVALAKEPSVSRDRHAIVIYEPKKRKFYLQPGEGSGLSYINEEILMLPSEFHYFYKLQFGEGEFIFRSLCGENFVWEDYT